MVQMNQDIIGVDSAIFMHPKTWIASGHVEAFNDPLIDNKDSKKRYRADVLIEDYLEKQRNKLNKEVNVLRSNCGIPTKKKRAIWQKGLARDGVTGWVG